MVRFSFFSRHFAAITPDFTAWHRALNFWHAACFISFVFAAITEF